jgi:hypothetical protein
MEKRTSLVILLELVWWVMTAVIVWAVLRPIYQVMYVWPFVSWNIIFVVTLVTLSQYIFLLKHTWLARLQELKVILMILMFPLLFVYISGLNGFMNFIEEKTWDPITGHLPPLDRRPVEQYMWFEMIFFGAGSCIAIVVFMGRMFRSVWTLRNRGVV